MFARTVDRDVADVWRVDRDGKLRRLTVTPIPPRGRPHIGTIPLAVAPSAKQLLVARHEALAVVSIDGGRPVVLRRFASQPIFGAWPN